jgi:hypothetical protein
MQFASNPNAKHICNHEYVYMVHRAAHSHFRNVLLHPITITCSNMDILGHYFRVQMRHVI